MAYLLHAATVRGPGHINTGLPNQDAVLVRHWKSSWLAVVSDGMGSRRHSDIGSRCACYAVLNAVRELPFDTSDKDLIHFIYRQWLNLLGEIKPNDAVATCLMAWGMASGKTRLLQLGDGAIIFDGSEKGVLVGRCDSGFGNETTGLGVSRKYSDWYCKNITLESKSNAIALLTDGISDDVSDEVGFLVFTAKKLKPMGLRYGKQWIKQQLVSWPTPAHRDDKTMALIQRV